jgi:membrane protein
MPWDIRELYARLTPDEVHHPLLVPLLAVGRWAMVFYLQLVKDQAFVRAGAMAYQTLVALVPMLLLVFGVLGATGIVQRDREALERLIFETFIADIPEVREFIMRGIGDLDLTALGIIGVAGMLIFAGRLFLLVEYSYNFIFGTKVRRGWGYRLLNFYFALTLVPVLVTLFFVGTIELAGTVGFAAWARFLLEPLVTFVLLLAALKLFPTVRVRWGPAALGASVSTVGILGGRWAFKLYLEWFKADDPLTIVYGSVGLIPVFLLWLYLVWVVVLLGVEVAYVFQNFRSLWEVERANLEGGAGVRAPRLHTALELLAWTGFLFAEGHGPADGEVLARRTGLLQGQVEPVLDLLVERGFLVRSSAGVSLSRPADRIELAEVVEAWRHFASPEREAGAPPTRVEDEVSRSLQRSLPPTLADAIERWVRPEVEAEERPLREVIP